ncbi:MAG TPA: hypothetical protein PLZ51_18295, partial [Aggregatilineales bacterium]|nr:hypothetical protein [Aggregatilineales bacterium]
MFNEPASSFDDDSVITRKLPPPPSESPQDDPRYETIRTAVEGVLQIEEEIFALDKGTTHERLQFIALSPDTK